MWPKFVSSAQFSLVNFRTYIYLNISLVWLIVENIQNSTSTSDLFLLNLFLRMSVNGNSIPAAVHAQTTGVTLVLYFSYNLPMNLLDSVSSPFKMDPESSHFSGSSTANSGLSQYYFSL